MEKVEKGKKYTINNSIFTAYQKPKDANVFLILLNQKFHGESTTKLIEMSDYFICADGGANRLFDYLKTEDEKIKYKPQKIVGDLDSLRESTREFYESVGVGIDYQASQDENDTEKALECLKQMYIESEAWQKKKDNIIYITGCFGKRLDHTLNNMSILHKVSKTFDEKFGNFTICMLGKESMAYCIMPGQTTFLRSPVFENDKGIGLIPLCGTCEYLETKGFKWDLGGDLTKLEFGWFISSSNEFVSTDEVQIKNSHPLLLTIPIRKQIRSPRKTIKIEFVD